MNQKKIVIAVITLSFLAFAWIGYVTLNPNQDNPGMVRFLSLTEIHTVDQTERIRLGGLVSPGTIHVSEQNLLECNFHLQQGIVEGNYVNGTFKADQLQTKCASRYEGDLRDESSYNTESI